MAEFIMSDGGNLGADFKDAPALFAADYKGASCTAVTSFGAAAGMSSIGMKSGLSLNR
ncbi:MAG: hypothetical protein AB7E85_04145 [Pseudobdellovibrionaceae bacterium]